MSLTGLTETTKVSLEIFTVALRKIAEQTYHSQGPGAVDLVLPLTDASGAPLANGVYYVIVRAQNQRLTLKLLILR